MFWCCMLNVDASRIRRPTEISNMITEIINRSQNERISPVWDCLFYRLFLMLFWWRSKRENAHDGAAADFFPSWQTQSLLVSRRRRNAREEWLRDNRWTAGRTNEEKCQRYMPPRSRGTPFRVSFVHRLIMASWPWLLLLYLRIVRCSLFCREHCLHPCRLFLRVASCPLTNYRFLRIRALQDLVTYILIFWP